MDYQLERHVIDLEDIGEVMSNFLYQVFRDNYDKHNIVKFVYNELLSQILLCITNDEMETHLRLIGLPEMRLFEHLPILNDPNVFEHLVKLTRHIGERLTKLVNTYCNPMGSVAQYYFDSASYTYLVLVKQIDINNTG